MRATRYRRKPPNCTFILGDEPAGAIAMLYNRFQIPEHAEADRMPAFLGRDWDTWLGQNSASPEAAKTCLKTVEGINWRMTKEERAASKAKRAKPTVKDPGGPT